MTVRKFENEADAREMHQYLIKQHKRYLPRFTPAFFQPEGIKINDGFFFILWGQFSLANERFHNVGKLKGEFLYRSRYQITILVWPMGRWKQQVPNKPVATKLAPQLLNLAKKQSAELEAHGKVIANWLDGKQTPQKPPSVKPPPSGGGQSSPKPAK
jgi:hypothetical protein